MAASYANEIRALGQMRGVEIRHLRLELDNFYTMNGHADRTMVGGAENPELLIEIDCDLDDAALNQFLLDATFAAAQWSDARTGEEPVQAVQERRAPHH